MACGQAAPARGAWIMKERLNNLYGLEPALIERSSVGAGSDTYFVTCADGKYVAKFPALSEINHPGRAGIV